MGHSDATNGLRQWLRAETAPLHDAVERRMAAFDPADPAGYAQLLQVQFVAVSACEDEIERAGGALIVPDWPRRSRRRALLDDLKMLKISPKINNLGGCKPGSREAAIGIAYVLEGSRLGGVILAKRLSANPSSICRSACAFLAHGQNERMWPTFLAFLDRTQLGAAEKDCVLRGAAVAFQTFLDAAERAEARHGGGG